MNNLNAIIFLFASFSFIPNKELYSQSVSNQWVTGSDANDNSSSFYPLNDSVVWVSFIAFSNDIPSGNVSSSGFGESDVVVQRLTNGQVDFEMVFGSTDFEGQPYLVVDNLHFYLLYSSRGGVSGNQTVSSFGDYDLIVTKVEINTQNIVWQNAMGGLEEEFSQGIERVSDSSLLVWSRSTSGISGSKTVDSYGNGDAWVIQLDTNGNEIWQNVYGGSGSESKVNLDHFSGRIYLAMSSTSDVSGNKSSAGVGFDDIWVVQIDDDGNIIHQNAFGGDFSHVMSDLSVGERVLVASSTDSPISGDKTKPNYGDFDAWVLLLDSNLNLIQDFAFGGTEQDAHSQVLMLPTNQWMLVTNSQSEISGNKTTPLLGDQDLWLVAVGENGTVDRQLNMGGLFVENIMDGEIWLKSTGEVQVACRSNSPVSGDKTIPPLVEDEFDLWSFTLDHFLATSFQTVLPEAKLFPTINDGVFTISGINDLISKEIIVTSLSGRQMKFKQIKVAESVYRFELESTAASGVYFISVFNQDMRQRLNKRFVVGH